MQLTGSVSAELWVRFCPRHRLQGIKYLITPQYYTQPASKKNRVSPPAYLQLPRVYTQSLWLYFHPPKSQHKCVECFLFFSLYSYKLYQAVTINKSTYFTILGCKQLFSVLFLVTLTLLFLDCHHVVSVDLCVTRILVSRRSCMLIVFVSLLSHS